MKISLLLFFSIIFLMSKAQIGPKYPNSVTIPIKTANSSYLECKKLNQEINERLYEIKKCEIRIRISEIRMEIERLRIEKENINIEIKKLEIAKRKQKFSKLFVW